MGQYLTVKEVSERFGLTRQAIYLMIKEGRLKSKRIGPFILVPESDAVKFQVEKKLKRVWAVRVKR